MEHLLVTGALLCSLLHTGCGVGRWDVFSTKTLYDWHTGSDIPEAYTNQFSGMGVSTTMCKAIQVNMVVRHGARYPTSKNIKKIRAIHKKIIASKDPTKFPELDRWKFRHDEILAAELCAAGIREQFDIGKRTATRFYGLLSSHPENIQFVSSHKSRALDSAINFNKGMQDYISLIPISDRIINDTTLRFYDGCYNYETQVEDNVTQFKEFNEFSRTPEFKEIADGLKEKLGIDFSLSEDDVYQIYELCAYETYLSDDKTWCNLLSDKERLLLEYGQDLEKYYESSYGHPINSQMACPLVRDIFNNMDKAANDSWNYNNLGDMKNTEYLAGKFQFGHSETLVPLLTALGLFKDTMVPLATNRLSMLNRKFRTSKIAPFSTNIAIVLYVCDHQRRLALQEFNPGQQGFRVRIFVNEEEVEFPTCKYMCLYKSIREAYKDLIDHCDIKQVCGEAPVETTTPTTTTTTNAALGGNKDTFTVYIFLIAPVASRFLINILP